jgi:hypothetical protein
MKMALAGRIWATVRLYIATGESVPDVPLSDGILTTNLSSVHTAVVFSVLSKRQQTEHLEKFVLLASSKVCHSRPA